MGNIGNFDNHLSFEPHIKNICKDANLILSALRRISPYLRHQKKREKVPTHECIYQISI